MGRLVKGVAVTAQIAVAHIIQQDKNYIGRIASRVISNTKLMEYECSAGKSDIL